MIYDAALLEPRLTVSAAYELGEAVRSLAWSPDGEHLAAASLGGEVAVVRPRTADRFVGPLAVLEAAVTGLAWCGSTGALGAVTEDGRAFIMEPSGSCTTTKVAKAASDLTWTRGGQMTVAGIDRAVLLDTSGRLVASLPAVPGGACVVEWLGCSIRGSLFLGGAGGIESYRMSGVDPDPVPVARWPRAAVVALAVEQSSSTIAAGTLGGDLELVRPGHDMSAASRLGRGAVSSISWRHGGGVIAVVTDGQVKVATTQVHGQALAGVREMSGNPGWITEAGFAPHDGRLASVDQGGGFVVWEPMTTPDPLERSDLGEGLGVLAWHPDGRSIAVGGDGGLVCVVDIGPRP